MIVLSLFDGIACGKVALERAGIEVDKYYASEIDDFPIAVARHNYPEIIELGDINDWKNWNIDFSSIDLVIGGSPCQGFSQAGNRLNFNDPRSKLFFVYVEILNHVKKLNPDVKFLLENVKMKKQWVDLISMYLGVGFLSINSNLVSAQNRPRLYWTNINVKYLPENKGLKIKDIVETAEVQNEYSVFKEFSNFYTIPRAKDNKLINGSYNRIWKTDSYCGALSVCNVPRIGCNVFGKVYSRKITVTEAEKLQTLPVGYTNCIKENKRFECIGNGWTIDVIAHIFSFLKENKDGKKE